MALLPTPLGGTPLSKRPLRLLGRSLWLKIRPEDRPPHAVALTQQSWLSGTSRTIPREGWPEPLAGRCLSRRAELQRGDMVPVDLGRAAGPAGSSVASCGVTA